MSRQLKVYNRFGELVLHLRFALGDALPLQVEDGTPELKNAMRALAGRDFDETVDVKKQRRRFEAKWGTPQYLDALAGYWSSNFGWQTRIIETCDIRNALFSSVDALGSVNLLTANIVGATDSNAVSVFNYDQISFQTLGAAQVTNLSSNTEFLRTMYSSSLFFDELESNELHTFSPIPDLFDWPTSGFSAAYGVLPPTAAARLRDNNPRTDLCFSVTSSQAWAVQ